MFDYTPLYRSSVGFDRLFRMLDEANSVEPTTYPPYNIERVGDDEYRITIAIAGFGPQDVNIEAKGNTLTVSGKKADKQQSGEVLHQGGGGLLCAIPSTTISHLADGSRVPSRCGNVSAEALQGEFSAAIKLEGG